MATVAAAALLRLLPTRREERGERERTRTRGGILEGRRKRMIGRDKEGTVRRVEVRRGGGAEGRRRNGGLWPMNTPH